MKGRGQGCSSWRRRLRLGTAMAVVGAAVWAGDTVRPGLEGLDYAYLTTVSDTEQALVDAIKEPLLAGRDVEKALKLWFDGRLADSKGEKDEAERFWRLGAEALKDEPEPPFLPEVDWGDPPDATLTPLHRFNYPECEGVQLYIVRWEVDGLKQYGVMVAPQARPANGQYPLILYTHGAAYGVPPYVLPWLAGMAREGYVIVGPAFRGEDLFAVHTQPEGMAYKCEGEIENLDGELRDALSAVAAAKKLPFVDKGEFGIVGHSFGGGAGLLATTQLEDVACMVSYDGWLTNPFRYYWDRMRRGANNWLSWADFCNKPVADQLMGLKRRSIVHHAKDVNCPLLLFIGGGYEGSVFHLSHADFIAELEKHNKPYEYDVVPDGGHNFVLYFEEEPAKYAYARHMAFLRKHLPPNPPPENPEAPTVVPPPPPPPPPPPARPEGDDAE